MKQTVTSGAFFDRFAETFDSFYDGKRSTIMQWIDRHYRSDMFVRYVLTFERLGNLEGCRGVDIGCGSGPYIAEALKRGAAHMMGLDPAPGMLGLTRRRIERLGQLDKLTLLEGYFPQVRPTSNFDFAIVMGVMDYVADPVSFLHGLRELVSGTAAVSFPSKHWFRTPLRKVRYRLRNCPVYFYDEQLIRSLGTQARFSTTDVVKIPGAGMDYHVCFTH
jgi:SAM-dependent methyltransferase